MNVTRVNEFKSAQGKEEEVFKFLKSLISYITSSEGCLFCEVLQSEQNKDKFLVIEKWRSVEDHKNSIENFPKEEMQAAMSLFETTPKGEYYHT